MLLTGRLIFVDHRQRVHGQVPLFVSCLLWLVARSGAGSTCSRWEHHITSLKLMGNSASNAVFVQGSYTKASWCLMYWVKTDGLVVVSPLAPFLRITITILHGSVLNSPSMLTLTPNCRLPEGWWNICQQTIIFRPRQLTSAFAGPL